MMKLLNASPGARIERVLLQDVPRFHVRSRNRAPPSGPHVTEDWQRVGQPPFKLPLFLIGATNERKPMGVDHLVCGTRAFDHLADAPVYT